MQFNLNAGGNRCALRSTPSLPVYTYYAAASGSSHSLMDIIVIIHNDCIMMLVHMQAGNI
jgi:hypothetical protein